MPAWLIPALMAAGGIFSGAAKGSADQRASENNQAAQRNALLAQLYNTRQDATMSGLLGQSREQSDHARLDLDRRDFALDAPSTRAGQSVRGSILANAQPASISGLPAHIQSRIPNISGGLTPSMFSGDTRALGNEMTRKALMDQLRGDDFEPLERTDFKGGILAQPQLEQYQRSGLLEKILGNLGLGLTVAGGIGGAIKSRGDLPTDLPDERLPVPYSGHDMYGNQAGYTLPRARLYQDVLTDDEV